MATAKEPELDWYIPLALEMVKAKYSYALGLHRRADAPSAADAPSLVGGRGVKATAARTRKAKKPEASSKTRRSAKP